MNIKNSTPVGSKTFTFVFGAHTGGSDSVDAELGEVEIPSIPLPGNIFYVWTVAPTQEPIWLSPKEVRKLQLGLQHREDYALEVNWTGGDLEFTWPSPLPRGIDSIWITDGYSDFPNNFLAAKVEPGASLKTSNTALERFTVIFWFNGIVLDVEDPNSEDLVERGFGRCACKPINMYPNPAYSYGRVTGISENDQRITVTDLHGRKVLELPTNTLVDLQALPQGMYVLHATDAHGNVCSTTFYHL